MTNLNRQQQAINVIAKALPRIPAIRSTIHDDEPDLDRSLATLVFNALREAGLLDPYASSYSPMLGALNRCRHGRHAKDRCLDCGGQSTGNLFLEPGQRIGTTLYGVPIVVPDQQGQRSNPARRTPGEETFR